MQTAVHPLWRTLHTRRAQLLLPAVLLLPLFVLVIYLLVEVTKVSIVKIRHQFALDNAAYSQVTTVSVFLNAVGLLNGPLPYRVLATYDTPLMPTEEGKQVYANQKVTVFDLFFHAGAVPTLASDYEWGHNPRPNPSSKDWGVHYTTHENIDLDDNKDNIPDYNRKGWEKETPDAIKGVTPLMYKDFVDKFYVAGSSGQQGKRSFGVTVIMDYLNTYVQVGDTFNLQKDLYQRLIKNAGIFREGYFLNVDDCKKGECARQSASRLAQFLNIPTKRQEVDKVLFYVSASRMAGAHGGAIEVPLTMSEEKADPLFMFAYVDGKGLSNLRALKRGIMLKQSFPLPKNHFNVDLATKYKPYVRNTVIMSCPRNNNNCVWPNPLPKYNVILRP